ncbi:MAG: XRE family transcriptional regulator [Clostridiales bacterium]|nr:XRE family transcriptional regulator [Clostridiales bacterium]
MKHQYMTSEETNRFKAYMVMAGYNITSLSDKINMSRECLSMRISGKVDFGRKEMSDIANVLNVEPSVIFFG